MSFRVTVLIALYNSGQFLRPKLINLRQQTAFRRCQIVLLNCQNIGGERNIYRRFAARNSNVKVIEYGYYCRLYKSWNDGIEQTKSDYIMNSNADDLMHPECIEKLIAALDANPGHSVAHCNSWVTDIPNLKWPDWTHHGEIITCYPGGTAGPCPMWRRSLHDKYGLFGNYRVIGDAKMWEKWHAGGEKFLNVPEHLVLYYHAPNHNLEIRLDGMTGRPMRELDLEDDRQE